MNDFDFEIPDLIGTVLPNTNELKILSVIGYGSFAVVYKAEDIDHNLFAVKCIVKKGLNSFQLKLQYREAALLQSLENHPNIVNLYQVIDTEENLFFVLDLCECDLFEAIVHNHGFGNQYTKEVFEILIDTVQFLHERKIYHRDLKPENILITVDGDIKIADFGLACDDQWSRDYDCGTLRYEPPECVDTTSKGYSPEKSDIWALGVILVNLRFERNPWAYASSEDNIYYEFSTSNPNILQQQLGLSDEMNTILKNIFKTDPEQRWNLAQLKEAILSIDEMYDESKYNPLSSTKSNHSTPIPITPISKKDSPLSYNFSSSNSSTYNNTPGFIKHYEDHMERNDFNSSGFYDDDDEKDENNIKEFTFNDQTFVNNNQYDGHYYLLNRSSLSHFSFCSRHTEEEEEDDFIESDEEEEEEEKESKVEVEEETEENQYVYKHENKNSYKYKHDHKYDHKLEYEHEHEKDSDIEDEIENKGKRLENKKENRKGKNHNLKIFCRGLENETFYLEDDLYSPRDNRLYRSIKVGSICSRHSNSLRSNGSCQSIRSPFNPLHNENHHHHNIPSSPFNPLRNDNNTNHVINPTPLRINANIFSTEDEDEIESENSNQNQSDPHCNKILLTSLNHEVPESWEDYSFDELLSDDSSSKLEKSINNEEVLSNLKIKTNLNYQEKINHSRTNSPQLFSDKIASFYKKQLIGSSRTEVFQDKKEGGAVVEDDILIKKTTLSETENPDKVRRDSLEKEKQLENKVRQSSTSKKEKSESNETKETEEPKKIEKAKKVFPKDVESNKFENSNCMEDSKTFESMNKVTEDAKLVEGTKSNKIVDLKVNENKKLIDENSNINSKALINVTDIAMINIKTLNILSFPSEMKEDPSKLQCSYQWNGNSFFSKHFLRINFKEITLLNINFIWMSSQPKNYSFLLRYYIPQLPLYLYIFSVQLLDRIKKLTTNPNPQQYISKADKTIGKRKLEGRPFNSRNKSKSKIKKNHNPSIGPSFIIHCHCKSKSNEKCLTLVKSRMNPLFEYFINGKPLNYFDDEPYSILAILFKLLNNFIDIYHFSVSFKTKINKTKLENKTDSSYPFYFNFNNNNNNNNSNIINNNNTLRRRKRRRNNNRGSDDNYNYDLDDDTTTTTYNIDFNRELSILSTSLTSLSLTPVTPSLLIQFIKSSLYNIFKFILNDLTKYYKHTQSSLEMVFLFLVGKLKLFFLMMFIYSFQRKSFSLTFGIDDLSIINSKLNEKFIIIFHQFYSKFLYILLRTFYV